jgi:hypothetical protein
MAYNLWRTIRMPSATQVEAETAAPALALAAE